jgi:hypothetical protein
MHAPAWRPGSFLRPSKSGQCFGRNDLLWDDLKLKLGVGCVLTIAGHRTVEGDAALAGGFSLEAT